MEQQKPLDQCVSILSLMWFQECHNRYYHKDIYHLQTMRALAHFNNHLVKYNGVIERKMDVGEFAQKEILDAMICCMSAFSVLNYDLSNYYRASVNDDKKYVTFPDLYFIATIPRWNEIRIVTQEIAKLLEGWDHVEALRYREDLQKHFTQAFLIYYGIYLDNGKKGFMDDYVQRLNKIKEKNVFHEDYLKYCLPGGGYTPATFEVGSESCL